MVLPISSLAIRITGYIEIEGGIISSVSTIRQQCKSEHCNKMHFVCKLGSGLKDLNFLLSLVMHLNFVPLIDVNVSQLSDILTWRQKRPVREKINGHRIFRRSQKLVLV